MMILDEEEKKERELKIIAKKFGGEIKKSITQEEARKIADNITLRERVNDTIITLEDGSRAIISKEKVEEIIKKIQREEKEKNKDISILDEWNDKEEKFAKIIADYNNKVDLAKKFIELSPLYYDKGGLWWSWNINKNCWEMIDEVDILNLINKSSNIGIIQSKERIEILNALKQTARENAPKQPKKSWIQFDKEIIDIETGDRFNATSEYFFVNPIPYKLGKIEETPNMDKIFEEWVGKDYVKTLYEIIAYCLIQDYPIHRLFCFVGAGLNGKGCFLRLLKKFVGAYNMCSTELDTLITSRFEITRLHKKLVCQMGETNFNEISRTSILKKLTGQDLIGFEYKNKNPFEENNYAKIIIATNNLPTTSDKTIGYYRRWLIIDFPNRFNEKRDILENIPEEEYENLAIKSVGILIDLLKNREFYNEGSIEDRIKKYEERSNPLEKFWKEMIIEDFDCHIYKYDLKEKLKDFCKDNHFRELSEKSIADFMKEKNIESRQIQAEWFNTEGKKPIIRAWIGIKWK